MSSMTMTALRSKLPSYANMDIAQQEIVRLARAVSQILVGNVNESLSSVNIQAV